MSWPPGTRRLTFRPAPPGSLRFFAESFDAPLPVLEERRAHQEAAVSTEALWTRRTYLDAVSADNQSLDTDPEEAAMDRVHEVVDLTSSTTRRTPIALSSSPPFASNASSSQSAQESDRGRKRQRRHDHNRHPPSSPDIFLGAEAIETIDMTEDPDANELAKAVAKQREDAIKAQQTAETSDGPLNPLMAYKCPICMDTPVDATATSCGHLFCHKCIVDYLTITEETRGDSNKHSKGTCPVCRKPLSRKETSKNKQSLIPLQYKIHTKTRSELEAIRKKEEEEEKKKKEEKKEEEGEEEQSDEE